MGEPIVLTVNQMVGGSISVVTTPPVSPSPDLPEVSPSPYFTYDSNRVITGFVQGSPNVLQSGTYWGWSEEQEAEVEVSYSEYALPQPFALNDEYALGVGNDVFNCYGYSGYDTSSPPINRTVASINLPNATSIGDYAFILNCGFSTVNLPNVTSIGCSAFQYCEPLTSITIGSGIQGIGGSAFDTYGSPITLTIGKTVTEVQAMGQTDYDYGTNVPYSDWGLPSGSTIVCTNGTITI